MLHARPPLAVIRDPSLEKRGTKLSQILGPRYAHTTLKVLQDCLQVIRALGLGIPGRRIALARLPCARQLAIGRLERRAHLVHAHTLRHRLGLPVIARRPRTLELGAGLAERLLALQRLARGLLAHRVELARRALRLGIRGQHLGLERLYRREEVFVLRGQLGEELLAPVKLFLRGLRGGSVRRLRGEEWGGVTYRILLQLVAQRVAHVLELSE